MHTPRYNPFCYSCGLLRHLPSFPTRRSSDLLAGDSNRRQERERERKQEPQQDDEAEAPENPGVELQVHLRLSSLDRKSTRLNSSHLVISYAVFCLKKKKII